MRPAMSASVRRRGGTGCRVAIARRASDRCVRARRAAASYRVRPTFYVYILSSARRILYVGVTRDLGRRLTEHRTRFHRRCFTARYNVFALVHFERFPTPSAAIAREKEIERLGRRRKLALVEATNPDWRELAPDVPAGWLRCGGHVRRVGRDSDDGGR